MVAFCPYPPIEPREPDPLYLCVNCSAEIFAGNDYEDSDIGPLCYNCSYHPVDIAGLG